MSAPTQENGIHATNGVNGVHANGATKISRPLTAGIYAPIPTFFVPETEDLGESASAFFHAYPIYSYRATGMSDIPAFTAHVLRVAKSGVRPLLTGSMGEAHHLSHGERVTLIKAARHALDEGGFPNVPIIAGTGAGSTRETIQLCREAADAGADYTIVIASGYFAGVLASNKKALKAFWTEVAAKSPIPVVIYNCTSSFSPPVFSFTVLFLCSSVPPF